MDTVFKALSDSTRRQMLDALRRNDGQTLSQLANGFEMTRFGVMKHLAVLEDASLITTLKRGRFKHHYLNLAPLQDVADRWMTPMAQPATHALLGLKAPLEGRAPAAIETVIYAELDQVWEALSVQAVLPTPLKPWPIAPDERDTTDLVAESGHGDLKLTFRLSEKSKATHLSLMVLPAEAAPYWSRHLTMLKTLIETWKKQGGLPSGMPDARTPNAPKERPK